MLIGTYVDRGVYVAISVEPGEAERGQLVLSGQDSPGGSVQRVVIELGSLDQAVAHADAVLFLRAGMRGEEAEGLASSPVQKGLARELFSAAGRRRFLHTFAPQPRS